MSSDKPAIAVRDLSKCYQIYDRPSDRLKQFVLPRLQRAAGAAPSQYFREFWALRDVSLDIRRGASVGIVGRNGSGKSTLLQIICGTLSPTVGQVETQGRVAALLELGSGFNPEFSGRDNVYMNAALLGLSKNQIDARFDSIVGFADIGDHLEQPVKTYSSGMFVRLAFAVIAHVDADILVVDEALSVGDAVFTQRCMRFIRSFQESGTLLFVSHDTSAIQSLCETAIWLDRGRVQQVGPARRVSESYLKSSLQALYGDGVDLSSTNDIPAESVCQPDKESGGTPVSGQIATVADSSREDMEAQQPPDDSPATRDGTQYSPIDNIVGSAGFRTGAAEIESVRLEALGGADSSILKGGERVRLSVRARAMQEIHKPILGFLVKDRLGQDIFGENTLAASEPVAMIVTPGGRISGVFEFKLPMLPNGQYSIMASVASGDLFNNIQHHYLHEAMIMTVSSAKVRWGLVGIEFDRVALEAVDER